ncbi:hypothetical protein ACRRTK_023152 [Alexandromys fortis]
MACALSEIRSHLQIRSLVVRQCLAEFLGVLVLLLLTQGSAAQSVTSEEDKGNFLTMLLASSLAVTIAIYVAGNVSGPQQLVSVQTMLAHLALAPAPRHSVLQGNQEVCSDALQHYTGGNLTVTGPKETASIFATYPSPYLSLNNGFLDQVLGTWMLIVGLFAILDRRNKGVPAGLEPMVVGLLVLAIGLAMGSNCGSPLNPGPTALHLLGWLGP